MDKQNMLSKTAADFIHCMENYFQKGEYLEAYACYEGAMKNYGSLLRELPETDMQALEHLMEIYERETKEGVSHFLVTAVSLEDAIQDYRILENCMKALAARKDIADTDSQEYITMCNIQNKVWDTIFMEDYSCAAMLTAVDALQLEGSRTTQLLNALAEGFYIFRLYDKVTPFLERAMQINGQDTRTLKNIGKVLLAVGDKKMAEEYLQMIPHPDDEVKRCLKQCQK